MKLPDSPDPAALRSRRDFLRISAGAGAAAFCWSALPSRAEEVVVLPEGRAPMPLETPHFGSRMQVYVWRNWQLVPTDRLAAVVGASPEDILKIGKSLGLAKPPPVTADQSSRSYITVLRRNWHLLPYEQLLALLGWSAEQLAYTLRHDDGVFWKFGSLKPKCVPLMFIPEDETARARSGEISRILTEEFPGGVGGLDEPLFQFVADLSKPPVASPTKKPTSRLSPRFCHSYFAPYGDPLLDGATDPYPDGYLARLADAGVDGVWLQIVLSKLAPFPWDTKEGARHEERLRNLRDLVARARKHGIGLYLYLNEPRTMPLAFFESHPQLKGIEANNAWELGTATLCTNVPEVQKYLTEAVASICQAAPDLAGFFSITASEALTNCWSHSGGAKCPLCGKRQPSEVIAELNGLYRQGILASGTAAELIVWDWGWKDEWTEDIIQHLPADVSFMSVSEWSIPIERGGVKGVIGEYSISTVGPGPRATKNWELARKRGLKTIAKIQANNTWELSSVPYIPALENVAQHAANLRAAKVEGVMLGWSLGGYPSPNLEVVAELGASDEAPEVAMLSVAQRHYGAALAPAVVQAWQEFSTAFSEFPFGGGIYKAPMQFGPANLLWNKPTNYAAGPVGFPYDDLKGWSISYPPEVFIGQFEKIADGFDQALTKLKQAVAQSPAKPSVEEHAAMDRELSVAEAAAIHFRSTANQARFVLTRDVLATTKIEADAQPLLATMEQMIRGEMDLARRLYALQMRDSRLGFEASNHYYYVPVDLAEKVLNCRWLLDHLR